MPTVHMSAVVPTGLGPFQSSRKRYTSVSKPTQKSIPKGNVSEALTGLHLTAAASRPRQLSGDTVVDGREETALTDI